MMPPAKSKSRFSGDRLRLARAFKGLTQMELADAIVWSPGRISLAESGKTVPSDLVIDAVAEVTGFEPAFFFEPITEQLHEEGCSFRRKRSALKREKERLLARGTLLVELVQYLRSRMSLPEYKVPDIPARSVQEAERTALRCRETLGIDAGAPISRVGRVLENGGVVWVGVNAAIDSIDAFSHPGDVSIVFANTYKESASRTIFDLAHELGHLVMHRNQEGTVSEREEQAHRFAGAFLLPEDAFRREFQRRQYVEWDAVFSMKRRWRTSVAAIIHRAYDLGLLGAVQYRRAFQHIYARGWHRGEPDEPEPEAPEVVALAFASLEEEVSEPPQLVAKQLAWAPETLIEVTGLQVPTVPRAGNTLDINDIYKRKGRT